MKSLNRGERFGAELVSVSEDIVFRSLYPALSKSFFARDLTLSPFLSITPRKYNFY